MSIKEKKILSQKRTSFKIYSKFINYRKMGNSNILPLPISLGPNRILWDMDEIIEREKSRKEERIKCQ